MWNKPQPLKTNEIFKSREMIFSTNLFSYFLTNSVGLHFFFDFSNLTKFPSNLLSY